MRLFNFGEIVGDNVLNNKKKNDMKKYKLKQWYPSLPKEWKDRKGIVSFNTISNGYKMEGIDDIAWTIGVHEFNNEDFWELIEEKKPLFTTEDRVKIGNTYEVVVVDKYFIKYYCKLGLLPQLNFENIKVFAYESNADKYILWNKPLLSLQDIDATVEGCLPEFDELIKLAKERIK